MRRLGGLASLILALAGGGLAMLGAGATQADVFEPISLASLGMLEHASIVEQANVAEHPAISADGRYVAFDGSFGGVKGVWRRDLLTGAIEQVAGGDAELPSISEDGRYISFTTNEGASLPAITNGRANAPQVGAPNVYVRDMSLGPEEKQAFAVASAPSGSTTALAYQPGAGQLERSYGSVASGRSAMSADGRYVAFVTTALSNLVRYPQEEKSEEEKGEIPKPHTPAGQVAVRDLRTDETKLVSVEYENGATDRPVSTTEGSTTYGAVYRAEVAFPTTGPAALSEGASISADGSTVAWMGQEIYKQAPVLGGQETSPEYAEPLWRRIGAGAQEPTRRITGGADPASPACASSGETALTAPATLADPCQGPFEAALRQAGEGGPGVYAAPSEADFLPRLSENGLVVAFLASQRPVGSGEEFINAAQSDDLYVVDMADGLTRVQALRRLTELASGNANVGGGFAALADLGVSPDGSEIAFSTLRTSFPLGAPAYVSAPAAKPEMEELYDVDLANDTLTRVTHGYQGEAQQSEPSGALRAQMEAGSPSFSADGNTLTFSSAAANLAYGEGNKANSVFVVSRKRFAAEAVQQYVSPAPESPNTQPGWLLSVSARSRRDGSVLLEVQTPGAGRLSASAESAVRVTVARSHASRRGGRRSRSARQRTATKRTATSIANRLVARAAKAAGGEGLVTLVLSLASSYGALASEHGGLFGTVSLAFAAPGHAVLRERVPVTFLRTVHPAHTSKRRASRARRRR